MIPPARYEKKWFSVSVFIVLLTSVISCAALEEAQQRRHERIKRKLDGYTTTSAPTEEFMLRGQPAPLFTLQDLNGNQVSLTEFKGKPVVLNFWATWCGPCRIEIPHLEYLSNKYRDKGLVVLGLNNENNHQAVRDFAQSQISYTVLLDGHMQFQDYGVAGIPCTYYIGKKGMVRDRDVGFHGEAEMDSKIRELLSDSQY